MEIYYVNHENEKTDLMNGCYSIEESSLFEHSWSYESEENADYSGSIKRFKKGVQGKKIVIHITTAGFISCEQAFETLIDSFENDVLQKKPGKLYVNDHYLSCYVHGSKPKYFVPGIGSMTCEFEIAAEKSFWVRESSHSFQISQATSTENKQYPYTYGYRYAGGMKETYVVNGHFAESDFQMVIYGPVVNPQIMIRDNSYLVNIVLESGEYLKIDSRTGTIVKVMQNGETADAFHNRQKGTDFFKKIPSGRQQVKWPGSFDFDLIIYEERSVPKW